MTDVSRQPGFLEVAIRAPAKVNLGLEVRGRRGDGYHEIRTLFSAVSLADRLLLRRRPRGIRLLCRGFPDIGRENLAWKAAELFFRESGLAGGVEITLEKRIPVGGGLGGGSSDAAAVLLGASRLYGVRPAEGDLARWAASLGSDVPFFLAGGAALGTGRGERIAMLEGKPSAAGLVIYAPGFESSTAAVYGDLRPRRLTRENDRFTILLQSWRNGDLEALGEALFNDLESTVFRRHPELEEARTRLLDAGALGSAVSGSGACLFGLFPGRPQARLAAAEVRSSLSGRCFTADFLPARRRWGVVKR
jgi:4-diphosphocytidyl-2-C-methyl-D-erythritol kinase